MVDVGAVAVTLTVGAYINVQSEAEQGTARGVSCVCRPTDTRLTCLLTGWLPAIWCMGGCVVVYVGGLFILIGTPLLEYTGTPLLSVCRLSGHLLQSNSSGGVTSLRGCHGDDVAVDFFGGVGGSVFVGAGSAVMGYSPSIEVIPVVNKHKDFYIQV